MGPGDESEAFGKVFEVVFSEFVETAFCEMSKVAFEVASDSLEVAPVDECCGFDEQLEAFKVVSGGTSGEALEEEEDSISGGLDSIVDVVAED